MADDLVRLRRRAEFLRVAAGGRKSVTPGLILQARRSTESKDDSAKTALRGPRIGFTVSRKVGNAVARNRAKRRLRAVASSLLATHADPGNDYVLIGRKTTLERPFSRLMADLEVSLKRLQAWRDTGEVT